MTPREPWVWALEASYSSGLLDFHFFTAGCFADTGGTVLLCVRPLSGMEHKPLSVSFKHISTKPESTAPPLLSGHHSWEAPTCHHPPQPETTSFPRACCVVEPAPTPAYLPHLLLPACGFPSRSVPLGPSFPCDPLRYGTLPLFPSKYHKLPFQRQLSPRLWGLGSLDGNEAPVLKRPSYHDSFCPVPCTELQQSGSQR